MTNNFQGVKGVPFTAVCLGCGERKQFGGDPTQGFADLNGEAFKAYYCAPCVSRILAQDRNIPTFQNQLWHSRKIASEQGVEELRRHAMVGHQCKCGDCFCCAALQVFNELKAVGTGFGTPSQIVKTTIGILWEHAVNSSDGFRQWFYPHLPATYDVNPEAYDLAEQGMLRGESAAQIAKAIIAKVS